MSNDAEDALSLSEKQFLQSELSRRSSQDQSSMVDMIFSFFIQSGEYPFFVKRLKNLASTKQGGSSAVRTTLSPYRQKSSPQISYSSGKKVATLAD